MILFTILLIIFLALVSFAIIAISIGGAVFTIVFADVIVCAAIIAYIMYRLFFKKK